MPLTVSRSQTEIRAHGEKVPASNDYEYIHPFKFVSQAKNFKLPYAQ